MAGNGARSRAASRKDLMRSNRRKTLRTLYGIIALALFTSVALGGQAGRPVSEERPGAVTTPVSGRILEWVARMLSGLSADPSTGGGGDPSAPADSSEGSSEGGPGMDPLG